MIGYLKLKKQQKILNKQLKNEVSSIIEVYINSCLPGYHSIHTQASYEFAPIRLNQLDHKTAHNKYAHPNHEFERIFSSNRPTSKFPFYKQNISNVIHWSLPRVCLV